ncbi:hypothetical protein N0U24_24795 [Peribacillus frigoritolerans]|uniref:hypothetical protein n=1 Tax=Peribacillus frigoritolerans TaxID=450367 RepID=UPI0021AA1CE3|nr:hypothetical protein [Peribacillus frigoritolerans]MCT4480335.1 hypothetical protein [Peribacillus frigoritolerans]
MKTAGWSIPNQAGILDVFFTVILIVWKKIETLLPKSWLAEMRRGDLADREQILKTTGTSFK